MASSPDRLARTRSGMLVLAMLGLAAALAFLLIGGRGASNATPVYAQSPLLPPNLLAPPNGAVISDTTPTLSWQASPPPATGYRLKVDGFWVNDVGSATSGESYSLAEGSHTWTVGAYDGSGGFSGYVDPAWSFTVDTRPPPVPVLQSPANGSATSDTTVTLGWGASTGAAGYRLSWNGTIQDVGSNNWHVLTGLADGTYSWSVAAYDEVGNVSAYPTAWTVRVDTTPPVPPLLVSPADGDTIVDPTPTLQWTASAEATDYQVNLDGTETYVGNHTWWTAPQLGAGSHTWSVSACDALYNCSVYSDVWSFTLEIIPPVPPVLVYPENGAVISNTTPTLTWEEVPGAVNYWLTWGGYLQQVGDQLLYTVSAPESPPTYTWRVASVNANGQMSQLSDPYTFAVDITPPPVPVLDSPPDGVVLSTSTPLLSWFASPGAAGYYVEWDGVPIHVGDTTVYTATGADGPHTWTVASYDPVHNISAYTDTWTVTIDTTPPAVPELQSPAHGTVLTSTTVVLRWNAAADAVRYVVQWDGAIVYEGDALSHTVSTVDGPHTWTVAAYDHVNNLSDYAGAWSVEVDTTPPPVPDLLQPADGAIIASSTVALGWTGVVDAVGYKIKWDGAVMDVGNVTSYHMPAADGTHTWTVAAYDHVYNLSAYTTTWTFEVDTTPPPVPALQSPANGSVLTSTTTVLRWHTATDAFGYMVRWNGAEVNVGNTTAYTATAPADGTYQWTVAAYDHVGNVSAYAGARSLRVDTTPPTVQAAVPSDGATEVEPTAQLEIHFSEPVEPGTLQMSVSPDPGDWFAAWGPGNQMVTLSHAAFEVQTVYVVTVIDIEDVAGLQMQDSYSWSFETGMYELLLPIVTRRH